MVIERTTEQILAIQNNEFDVYEEIDKLKTSICFRYVDTKSKTWPWPIKEKLYDKLPRKSENLWNYDKLGRPFRLGQAILWFNLGKNNQLIQHVAFITSHRLDTDVYYANPVKSGEYMSNWEKSIRLVGNHRNYVLTDSKLEVSRLRQEFGAIIIGSLYDSLYLDENISTYAHL